MIPRAAANTPNLSPACTVAKRPGYEDLHEECSQTEDVPLPGEPDIRLVRRCTCACHKHTRGPS